MSALPSSTKVMLEGLSDEPDPAVLRTEMERGVPVQRLVNSGVLVALTISLYFESPLAAAEFETWYMTVIKRIGWFDLVHPLTGATLQVRFRGGSIGALTPLDPSAFDSRRQVTVEYLRP